MVGDISTQRVFSLSCFEGLRLLRKYMPSYPDLRMDDLLDLIKNVEADANSLDMEASVYLSNYVENDCPLDGHTFYQICIREVLLKLHPPWIGLMRQGRRRFVSRLNTNDQDVFAAAGLMQDPTPRPVVAWWDAVSGHARTITDQRKMDQGREAEILTLEHERERLRNIGIGLDPQWLGFDDNFAGYDVLSYDLGAEGAVNRFIEVKSTTQSPLRFIVTRHEWDKAKQASGAYIFHVWDMNQSPPILHVRSVSDVAPHIPVDSGKGSWRNAQIPVLGHRK